MNRLIHILLLWVVATMSYGQESGVLIQQEVRLTADCEPYTMLLISLEDPADPDWPLPYQITVVDMDAGVPYYYEMDAPLLEVGDLPATGMHEVTIYLGEECKSEELIDIEEPPMLEIYSHSSIPDCGQGGIWDFQTDISNTVLNWSYINDEGETESGTSETGEISLTDLSQGIYDFTVEFDSGCSLSIKDTRSSCRKRHHLRSRLQTVESS